MDSHHSKIKIGIIGCGAIGSRIAKSIKNELSHYCLLKGLYDIVPQKAEELAKSLKTRNLVCHSTGELISRCQFVVEAVNSPETERILSQILKARKGILVMSVGRILNAKSLFSLANRNKCPVLIPSGAISGLDAVKAASQVKIKHITLTTRKSPAGFAQSEYLTRKGIQLKNIRSETVLYDGNVDKAIKFFPQNINVAATLALASGALDKIRIKIIASPEHKTNSHEVVIEGDFGKMISRTENVVCPDNAKTSYLAVLSAIRTLKQHFERIKIGT